ncbi:hypothetical protein [Polaromonas sp. JS666]|uniref:hypothetical protein n=1 Tax=Polaromonas sp. (strain JS666 / ATCC BAA-500) TaxID=296591 RepID=UPI0000463F72|nr:hypothetical protein [Polaromonas sp. JS666]
MNALTDNDLAEFVRHFRNGLGLCDVVAPIDVIGLHSDAIAEDGKRIRLYDLAGGRTGVQIDDGEIRYCD